MVAAEEDGEVVLVEGDGVVVVEVDGVGHHQEVAVDVVVLAEDHLVEGFRVVHVEVLVEVEVGDPLVDEEVEGVLKT